MDAISVIDSTGTFLSKYGSLCCRFRAVFASCRLFGIRAFGSESLFVKLMLESSDSALCASHAKNMLVAKKALSSSFS